MKFYVKEKGFGPYLNSSVRVYESIKILSGADQESFWVIGFNGANKEIFRECIFMGGVISSPVDFKILFRRLIQHNCCSFVVVHNHPSGEINPSDHDIKTTEKIMEASKLLDFSFLDHLIIGDDKYYSFADEGMLR